VNVGVRRSLAFATFVALSGTLHAAVALPLRDVVAVALRRSPEAADARLAGDIARADALGAEGPLDTRLEANWQYTESFAPVYLASVATTQILRLRDLGFDQSMVKRFSTGTELSLGLSSLTETVLGGAQEVTLTREALQLRLVQPLLRGAWAQANLSPLRAARHRETAAQALVRARLADLVRAVEVAYLELGYAEQELEILEQALEATRHHVEEARKRVRAGRLAPADVLVVERAVAVAADELVAADARRRERALELARLSGVEVRDLGATERVRARRRALRPEAAEGLAHAAPVAQAADAIAAARVEDANATATAALPRIDLFGSLGPAGERPAANAAFGALFRFEEVAWSLGLQLSWSPAGSASSAAEKRAEAERSRAALQIEIARRDTVDQAQKVLARVEAASRRIELAQHAIELARRAVTAEQARFEAGLATAKSVLDRQIELAQTELREARVETDLAVAYAELDGLTGANLERYRP
jgi:outer membrane protein TolC